MISIYEVIVVEGKYDKMKLQQVVDSPIITTDGFDIFKNEARRELFRKLARERGLLVLTDSDDAGFRIRNYIKSIIGGTAVGKNMGVVKHAYIPDVFGKEKRKEKASSAGMLGVEGMDVRVLEEAILQAGGSVAQGTGRVITKVDMFEWGLLGGEGSGEKRKELCSELGLPIRISTNSLLEVLNVLYTYEQFCKIVDG